MQVTVTNYIQAHKTALITVSVATLLFLIIKVVSRWRIFNKMGESGWKSIIPIYNTIVLYDYVWSTAVFWFSVFLSFLGSLAGGVLKLFQNGVLENTGRIMKYLYLGCEYYILGASVLLIIFVLIFNFKYARAFGKGILFMLGLLFLPRIFELILAFGKAEYEK